MNVHYKKETLGNTKFVVHALLKFGSQKRIKDLYESGTISFQAIQEHRDKHNDYRFDSYEGVEGVETWGPGVLTLENPETHERINVNLKNASYTTFFEETHGNICSFYSFTNLNFLNSPETFIDPKMKEFGTHALFIKNVAEFNRRLDKAMNEAGLKCFKALVAYYDPYNFNGNPTIFQKPIEYNYQHEWRLYLERVGMDRVTVNIGSLKDISQMVTSVAACETKFT